MHKYKLAAFILAITMSIHSEASATCVPCPSAASLNTVMQCDGEGHCDVYWKKWTGGTPWKLMIKTLTLSGGNPVYDLDRHRPMCIYTTNIPNLKFAVFNDSLQGKCIFPPPQGSACQPNEFSCS